MRNIIAYSLVVFMGLTGAAFAQQQHHYDRKMQDKGMSQSRQTSDRDTMQQTRPQYYEERQSQQQQTSRRQPQDINRVQGQVQSMRTVNLTELNEQHVLAKIKTRDGRIARVDLGPKDRISRLDLQQGDRITVFGTRGKVNDQSVLMARRIQTDGQSVNISRAGDRGLKRFDAQVLGTNTASFKRFTAPEQLFARVRLDNGVTTTALMGPTENYKNVNIEEGEKISILASPASVQGKNALIAHQVRADGKVISVDWGKAQKQGQSRQMQDQGGQMQGRQQQ